MSTGTAVEMGIVKTGMASQALRDLHLLDSRLNPSNGWMNVALNSSKTPQQQSNLSGKESAGKQTGKGRHLVLVTYEVLSPNKSNFWQA